MHTETISARPGWVDILAYNSSLSPIVYNYAIGGNTVNVSETTLNPTGASDMITQVGNFSIGAGNPYTKHEWNGDNSLFISWFGM